MFRKPQVESQSQPGPKSKPHSGPICGSGAAARLIHLLVIDHLFEFILFARFPPLPPCL